MGPLGHSGFLNMVYGGGEEVSGFGVVGAVEEVASVRNCKGKRNDLERPVLRIPSCLTGPEKPTRSLPNLEARQQ